MEGGPPPPETKGWEGGHPPPKTKGCAVQGGKVEDGHLERERKQKERAALMDELLRKKRLATEQEQKTRAG